MPWPYLDILSVITVEVAAVITTCTSGSQHTTSIFSGESHADLAMIVTQNFHHSATY